MEGETIDQPIITGKVNNGIEQLQYSYFENSNALCRHIISEQKALLKHLGSTWNDLDGNRRDALLDLLFVDNVREQYCSDSCRHIMSTEIPESFPTLYIDSGQKINVDFENDLWTWRDEHSGPFSWMSRSQQDLTLADLEPDNISKPQPRSAKGDTDTSKSDKVAEEQFSYPVNSWSRDIIDGFRRQEKNIVVTPSTSGYFSPKYSNNDSEDKSQGEQTTASTLEEIPRTSRTPDSGSTSNETKMGVKERRTRSPSPKKIIRSSSLRRSPSKTSDHGEQKLIADKSEEAYEEKNTFSNPVMETEWSNFIGDETDTDGPINLDHVSMVSQREPVIQIMDRGRVVPGSSPYQGDRVQLISPTDSPSQASGISAHLASPGLSSWSAESTPDHSTHLLKGMQGDDKSSHSHQYQNVKPECQVSKYETEEVLTIETHGNEMKIVTKPETNAEDDDMPTTGFDFLDNW